MEQEEKGVEARLLAALAHGSAVAQGIGILVGVLVYVTQRDKSRFAAFHVSRPSPRPRALGSRWQSMQRGTSVRVVCGCVAPIAIEVKPFCRGMMRESYGGITLPDESTTVFQTWHPGTKIPTLSRGLMP